MFLKSHFYEKTSCYSIFTLLFPSFLQVTIFKGFPVGSGGKESAYNLGDLGLIPGVGKITWRREWQPTPVLLPGEFHRQRSLAGYSPWSHKELDTSEPLTLCFKVLTFHLIKKVR